MLTTARILAARLSVVLMVVAAYAITVGNGVLPNLIVPMGECSAGGSTGCT